MTTITASLRRRDDLPTLINSLTDAKARTFRAELNGPGIGSLQLQNDDAALGDLSDHDVILFSVDGTAAFGVLVRLREQRTVDSKEEAGQFTTLSGPGLLGILDEAIVYPSRGTEVLPFSDDRAFGWMSPEYDDSGWLNATELASVGTGTWWVGWPVDWPEPMFPAGFGGTPTQWIGFTGDDDDFAPEGELWFRRTFTVPSDVGSLDIFMGCDNAADLYLDGERIMSGSGSPPREMYHSRADVTSGTHTFAAKLTNFPEPEPIDSHGNPRGLVLTCYPVGAVEGVGLGTPIDQTNSNWLVTDEQPGMTIGRILRLAVEEAQDRGAIPEVGLDFDDDLDTAGNPWAIVNVTTKIGADLLTFFRELEANLIFYMDTTSFTLKALDPGSVGFDSGSDYHPPTSPTDPTSGNLTGLVHKVAT